MCAVLRWTKRYVATFLPDCLKWGAVKQAWGVSADVLGTGQFQETTRSAPPLAPSQKGRPKKKRIRSRGETKKKKWINDDDNNNNKLKQQQITTTVATTTPTAAEQ